MSACITTTNLSSRGEYPAPDPRRMAGSGSYDSQIGAVLAADGMVISLKWNPKLSGCEMRVNLTTTLAEPKDILAWNFFKADLVDRIGSPGLGLPSSMTIRRSSSMGLSCGQGADTIVLRRRSEAFSNWQAWYLFTPADFWDFWGGFNVTINWFSDTNRGFWGDQTPAPMYPIVPLPDNTLMVDNAGNFSVVFGGTDFAIPPALVGLVGAVWGPPPSFAIPARPLPTSPVDFTLVQELFGSGEVYVVFGGAGFRIPDPATTLPSLRLTGQIKALPPGGAAKLRKHPFDGTFLREQSSSKVYLAHKGKLRLATKAALACIPPRNVRVVPDKALAHFAKGPNLAK
jgi:hypothetical protein